MAENTLIDEKETEEEVVKVKKRTKKIQEGIRTSKITTKTKKTTTKAENVDIDPEIDVYAIETENELSNINAIDTETAGIKDANAPTNKKRATKAEKTAKAAAKTPAKRGRKSAADKQNEIKMHTENNLTEITLKKNKYKIELQRTEYDIYTEENATSYIIVREPNMRIVSGGVYILLEKLEEDYLVTTNQDFEINYLIDNLQRRDNVVHFKLTNLAEIIANEEGIKFEINEEKIIENNLEDNHTLIISEEDGKVYLPYTKEEVKNEVVNNKGTKIKELIENKYVVPLDKYKSSMRARFREGYKLMYEREGKSRKSAFLLGLELMFETNLHPAIISACKNLEELDIYLDCLEDNELEKFSCFKIIYKSLPTLTKSRKMEEY